jgi:hypothetical protein
LPLVWGTFNLKCLDPSLIISWQTIQEQNTASFTIQGSRNGSAWNDIATVTAAGQSSSLLHYNYTIQQPSWDYYRIIQADLNGHMTYSPVFMPRCGEKDFFNVYPNPVPQNAVNVSVSGDHANAIWLRLYDSKGSLLKEQRKTLQPGMNQLILNLPSIPQGIYSLTATWDNGKTKTVKLLKQ